MKQVLVIHYSQSGQLTEIIGNVTAALDRADDITVTHYRIEMETPFPFPWKKSEFLDVFPETFLRKPRKTRPVPETVMNGNYDLIIFGYQVWYLTPALPVTSFLNTPEAKTLFSGTPVVTVIGCRNMWITAQEKMKRQLRDLNASLTGNIVLADRHSNHISAVTIVHWMFSGKKSRFLGLFPKPGVSQKDIEEAVRFGPAILKHLRTNNPGNLQATLLSMEAVKIKPFLITADRRANIIFSKWARIITQKGEENTSKRTLWIKIFSYYLIIAIWIIAPLVFIVFLLMYFPLRRKIRKDIAYYSSVNMRT